MLQNLLDFFFKLEKKLIKNNKIMKIFFQLFVCISGTYIVFVPEFVFPLINTFFILFIRFYLVLYGELFALSFEFYLKFSL